MKKVLSLILALVLVLTLSACGNNETSQEHKSEGSNVKQSTTVRATEAIENTDDTVYADDEFSLEEVKYEVDSFGVIICFKFRNVSKKHLDRASFTVQMLDTNGDIVDTKYIGYIDGIDPGQGVWYELRTDATKECSSIQELSARIHSFKIVSLDATEDDTDNYGYYSLDFKNPIIIEVASIEAKG